MGFCRVLHEQLASFDMVFSYAWLSAVWGLGRRSSFSQYSISYRKYNIAVLFSEENDIVAVAERICRGGIRTSSDSRRVSRLDSRTQRRIEYVLLAADNAGVRELC